MDRCALLLLSFDLIVLCICIPWDGPLLTTIPKHPQSSCASVDVVIGVGDGGAKAPKQAIIRRQSAPSSICGFENGQSLSPITCDAGLMCTVSAPLTVLSGTTLLQDCCATSASVTAAASCPVHTSCADYLATITSSNSMVLTCPPKAPYCQSFTYPEVDAVSYGCNTNHDATWRTISLSPSSSINSPSSTTSSYSAVSSVTQSETFLTYSSSAGVLSSPSVTLSIPPTPTPTTGNSSGSIQDLTRAQEAGIGVGCGCALVIIMGGIIQHNRIRRRQSRREPRATLNEKALRSRGGNGEGHEPAMQETSS